MVAKLASEFGRTSAEGNASTAISFGSSQSRPMSPQPEIARTMSYPPFAVSDNEVAEAVNKKRASLMLELPPAGTVRARVPSFENLSHAHSTTHAPSPLVRISEDVSRRSTEATVQPQIAVTITQDTAVMNVPDLSAPNSAQSTSVGVTTLHSPIHSTFETAARQAVSPHHADEEVMFSFHTDQALVARVSADPGIVTVEEDVTQMPSERPSLDTTAAPLIQQLREEMDVLRRQLSAHEAQLLHLLSSPSASSRRPVGGYYL